MSTTHGVGVVEAELAFDPPMVDWNITVARLKVDVPLHGRVAGDPEYVDAEPGTGAPALDARGSLRLPSGEAFDASRQATDAAGIDDMPRPRQGSFQTDRFSRRGD